MFKVNLTKEQWARVCAKDEEIAAEVAKQQPELGRELGYELVQIVRKVTPAAAEEPKKKAGDK